jgi:integrase
LGYGEKRGKRWRARYERPDGTIGSASCDEAGNPFLTKRAAKDWADDQEAAIRRGTWHDPRAGEIKLAEWADQWWQGLNLAPSTMRNYRRHLDGHIIPEFGSRALGEIFRTDIDSWDKCLRAAGTPASTVRTWRGTLHTLLEDALADGLIRANPAAKRRGKGRRTGRYAGRGPEKVITDPLGALLIAERAAILAGRDDEFVAVILGFYTGMRWGEVVGLETAYVRPGLIRVEWQLYELEGEGLIKCRPKDDSHRDVDVPDWLWKLVTGHIARIAPRPCACHGYTYVFRGRKAAGRDRGQGAHWRRSGFGDWVFEPAVSGWYPKKSPQPRRPVPLAADPWPGRPLRGRNNQGRAEMCWLPIADGMTPHGWRHAHKSHMGELRIPEVLSHDRLGHKMGGIAGVYSHVTPAMRAELMNALTGCWERSLEARAAMNPHSPVPVLDALLQEIARKRVEAESAGDQHTGQLPNGSQDHENEEPPGSPGQNWLPNGSHQGLQAHVVRPRKRPLTWVGVAGFEPAASSSRKTGSPTGDQHEPESPQDRGLS